MPPWFGDSNEEDEDETNDPRYVEIRPLLLAFEKSFDQSDQLIDADKVLHLFWEPNFLDLLSDLDHTMQSYGNKLVNAIIHFMKSKDNIHIKKRFLANSFLLKFIKITLTWDAKTLTKYKCLLGEFFLFFTTLKLSFSNVFLLYSFCIIFIQLNYLCTLDLNLKPDIIPTFLDICMIVQPSFSPYFIKLQTANGLCGKGDILRFINISTGARSQSDLILKEFKSYFERAFYSDNLRYLLLQSNLLTSMYFHGKRFLYNHKKLQLLDCVRSVTGVDRQARLSLEFQLTFAGNDSPYQFGPPPEDCRLVLQYEDVELFSSFLTAYCPYEVPDAISKDYCYFEALNRVCVLPM